MLMLCRLADCPVKVIRKGLYRDPRSKELDERLTISVRAQGKRVSSREMSSSKWLIGRTQQFCVRMSGRAFYVCVVPNRLASYGPRPLLVAILAFVCAYRWEPVRVAQAATSMAIVACAEQTSRRVNAKF